MQVLQCCLGARRRRGAVLDAQTTPRAHLGAGQSAWLGTLAALRHLHIYPPAPLCAGVCPSSGQGTRLDSPPVALAQAPRQQQQGL